MFFQGDKKSIGDGLNSAASQINIIEKGIRNIGIVLKETLSPKNILKDAAEINNAVADMTTTALGQGRVISDALTNTIAQANVETSKFGISTAENVALFASINKELQNTKILTSEQIASMQALAKIAGLTNEDMANFAVNFDTLGLGIDRSVEEIKKLQREARGYGINVGQFMSTVGKNIKLVASYNFKGGVDGLSKMVAQAQSLRIDMSKTVQFAEKLMDPSEAIRIAAGFQMIGGAVGKLGQPFQLLNMAQTDMAGLQDEIVKMTAAAVTFNESTGEFDIPVTELYRLREVASLTGIGFQDLSEMALNSAKKTKKLNFLEGLNNIPEEQKEMVANLGELKDGKVMISIDDKLVEASELVPDQLAKLSSLEEDMGKTDKQLAVESVGHLKQIENSLKSLAELPESIVIEEGLYMDVMDGISTNMSNITTTFTDEIKKIEFEGLFRDTFNKLIPERGKEELEGFFGNIKTFVSAMTEKIEDIDLAGQIENLMSKSNISKVEFGAAENLYFSATNIVNASNPKKEEETNNTEEPQPTGDLVVTSQGESFQTAVDDYIFAISEQNLADLTNTISGLALPEMFKIPEINYEPPVVNVNNNSLEETLSNTISGLQSPEIIKTSEINYEPPVVNDKLFEIFNYLVNKENNVNDNINDANLNVNGTVTLNLEGTNQNFTQVDFNRLAQNNPEFIAMLKNALFNLDNRIDSSIMA